MTLLLLRNEIKSFFLAKTHSPDIIFLSEPKTPNATPLAQNHERLGYVSFFSNSPHPPALPSIWCFTKASSSYSIALVNSSTQHLTISSSASLNCPSTFITAIYASTSSTQRRSLWQYLCSPPFSNHHPWAVTGDFNAVSSAVEKLSIHPINSPATSEFTNMMISSGLLNIGFFGSRFT
ncbi:hypothetical protein MRB53_033574 [Persea americana]|uniref:Uncharacterized protein n=1 Tax=Persea americana TaxID=3435 RepID=A0ACC2KUX4_PERAE|nr:hypothetical protein MRB53_033574 [Persea americana]